MSAKKKIEITALLTLYHIWKTLGWRKVNITYRSTFNQRMCFIVHSALGKNAENYIKLCWTLFFAVTFAHLRGNL